MRPMHFLVEPDTLQYLQDRRVFVAEKGGDVVGYLVASPVPARNGWLIEQAIRHTCAPNGTVELLLDSAIQVLAEEGAGYVTLGLAPLSVRSPQAMDAARSNPLWLRLMLKWLRAHGRRFYNFDGLDSFKAKFDPDYWEPVYAISDHGAFTPQALYAIAAAFSQGAPCSLVGSAIIKAGAKELARLIPGQR